MIPERSCSMCGRPARFVAADKHNLEWFECGYHNALQNRAEVVRVRLTPIRLWFLRIMQIRYRCQASEDRLMRLRVSMDRVHRLIYDRKWSDLKASINWLGKEISREIPRLPQNRMSEEIGLSPLTVVEWSDV